MHCHSSTHSLFVIFCSYSENFLKHSRVENKLSDSWLHVHSHTNKTLRTVIQLKRYLYRGKANTWGSVKRYGWRHHGITNLQDKECEGDHGGNKLANSWKCKEEKEDSGP